MSLFHLFGKRPDLAAGIAKANATEASVLLDVRSAQEYSGGHIPGSVNLPLDQLPTIDIDKNRPLFVYCHSGARSAQACSYLNGQGYSTTNIGGVSGYKGPLNKKESL